MTRRVTAVLVVAVLAVVLSGVVLVLVGRSRSMADRARCQDNQRRICQEYILDEVAKAKAYPAGTVLVDAKVPPDQRLSWVVPGLARLGFGDLAAKVDPGAPWRADANHSAAETFVGRFVCPTFAVSPRTDVAGPLYYLGVAGVGPEAVNRPTDAPGAGMFRYNAPTYPADVKDGLSHTLLLMETATNLGPWIAGGPTSVRPLVPAQRPYVGPGRPFGGCHFGGANVSFADGSGRFLTDSISPDVLERLAGIADGGKPVLSNP